MSEEKYLDIIKEILNDLKSTTFDIWRDLTILGKLTLFIPIIIIMIFILLLGIIGYTIYHFTPDSILDFFSKEIKLPTIIKNGIFFKKS